MKILLCLLFIGCTAALGQTTNSSYVGPDDDNWNNSANWSPTVVPNNGAGMAFNVALGPALVHLDLDVVIETLDLNTGGGSYLLDNTHQLSATNTTVGDGLLELTGQGIINLGNLADFSTQTLNSGGIRIDANMPGQIAKVQFNGADIVNNYGAVRILGADAHFEDENGNSALRNFALNGAGAQFRVGWGAPAIALKTDFQNLGHFVVRPGGTATFTNGFTTLEGDGEDGLVEVLSTDNGPRTGDGALIATGAFGNQNAAGDLSGKFELTSFGSATATVQYNDANIVDFVGRELSLQGPGARIVDQFGQDALRNWSANHCLDFGAQFGARTQNISGNFDNAGVFGLVGDAHVNVAGNFTSSVLLALDVFDLYQVVTIPGFPPSDEGFVSSDLTVMGDLMLTNTNDLWILPYTPAIIDKAVVHGTATLGGTLSVIFSLDDTAAAVPGATFTFLQSDHPIAGAFSNVASGGRVNAYFFGDEGPDFTVPAGSFHVDYSGNELTLSDYQRALPAELGNLSTRLRVQTGDNAGIAGFIINGTGSKQTLLRAVGPSLNTNGTPVSGRLEDTVLELRDHNGALLTTNDDWRNSPNAAAIEATGLAPTSDLEAAILQTLTPGAYTAIIRGKDNTSGIGLVEVYDVGPAADTKLANLSTRGFVEAGDNVLIGGLIAGTPNTALTTMVVRAAGPSLAQYGVPTPLQDPILEVHDGDGNVIASNDNWMSDQQAEIESYGLGLSDPREAAVVLTMASGPRTVVVHGAGETTGVALVEIYNVGAPTQSRPAESTILRRSGRPGHAHRRCPREVGKAR